MAYSNFSLPEIVETFGLKIEDKSNLFAATPEVSGDPTLQDNLASAIRTEKARSELIIMPVLLEIYRPREGKISLFSGVEFNVDEEKGLVGGCDFLVSLSPIQVFVNAPVIAMVEARKDILDNKARGQCAAEMVAAQIFNERKKNGIKKVYGAVTTGFLWQFLKLEKETLWLDAQEYHIRELDKIMGIFVDIVSEI